MMKYLNFFFENKHFVRTANVILSSIVILSWLSTACFFMFYYRFSFNFETDLNNQYKMFFSLPLVSSVLIGLLFKKNFKFSLLHITVLVAVSVFLSLLLLSKYYSWSNEYFTVVATTVFISSGLLILDRTTYLRIIIISLLSIFCYEVYLGFVQWFETDDSSSNLSLAITGTLQNSGIYACYLLINLPFLYYLFFDSYCHKEEFTSKNKRYIFIFYWIKRIAFISLMLLACYIIIITQSRTAYCAIFVVAVSFLIINNKKTLLRIKTRIPISALFLFIAIAFCVLVYAFYCLFNVKKLSAIGRLMRIDVTLHHIGEQFWSGTGLGRFTWYYPQWQADYFATHQSPPSSYFMSAGESYIIFNEYLQLFKEIGPIGFILFVFGLVIFFSTKSKMKKSLLNACKLTVVAILACGFTSYSLHVNIFLLIFLFCFMVVLHWGDEHSYLVRNFTSKSNKIVYCILSVVTVISIMSLYSGYHKYSAALEWSRLTDSNAYHTDGNDVSDVYDTVYPYLKTDGKFLMEYAGALMRRGDHLEQVVLNLEKAKQYFISKATIDALANAYAENGDYDRAIVYYQWLTDFLPNQFRPRFKLLETYIRNNDSLNVRRVANLILKMPIKVQSSETERIKMEARKVLIQYN